MRVAMLFYVGGLLITVLSMKYVDLAAAHSGALLPRLVPVLGMTVFCAGIVISGSGRCPRCLSVMNPFISLYRRCPSCGIGLDEPCS